MYSYEDLLNLYISIHAAQEGCDAKAMKQCLIPKEFQSTQPKRAATWSYIERRLKCSISIHAAQEGCDTEVTQDKEVQQISIHAAQEGCDGNRYAR